MAVQFNLLPDVKLEFAKQQRTKRLVYSVAALASIVAIIVASVAYISVGVFQKRLLDNAGKDIATYTQKLNSIQDLGKILTIQNQLNSLPGLHQQKHYVSRLFTYLPQVTPTTVSITKLDIDTAASTIVVSGSADTVKTVNIYVDTLKFTGYILDGVKDQTTCNNNEHKGNWDKTKSICTKPAFSNVVLSMVGRDDKAASYTIDASFDSTLFTGTKNLSLNVPQETTTRSVLESPDLKNPLFNGPVKSNGTK
jgi:Tfp pilus assembly protein PilN